MSGDLSARCTALVVELDLGSAEDVQSVTPLTGGVASDIAKVVLADKTICIKFALPKLKVAEEWHAPVHRNKAEYAWLQTAARIAPDVAPKLYGRSEAQHGFAMAFLDGADVYLWKDALLRGRTPRGEAAQVADFLGRIHAFSARPDFDPTPFQNRDDFNALRLDPYLRFTARQHPAVAQHLTSVADRIYATSRVLIHGDVSPKNILIRGGDPVLLDAECATMGDPGFDVAFCLNHLVLKAFHLPKMRAAYLAEAAAFWDRYAPHVAWEDESALERRVARLLPMLMLARVDGKSPVEYLDPDTATQVRRTALALIRAPLGRLDDVYARVHITLEGNTS